MGREVTGPPSTLTLLDVGLFATTMALVTSPVTARAGQYVGIAFHLLLLPVIATTSAWPVGRLCGSFWVLCDVVASVGRLWTPPDTGRSVFEPIRMAGHVFAAIWIVAASAGGGTLLFWIGSTLAVSFGGYALAAGRLPEHALAVPGVLMLAWLLLLAFDPRGDLASGAGPQILRFR